MKTEVRPMTRFNTVWRMLSEDWRITTALVLLIGVIAGTILWVSLRIQRQVASNLSSSLNAVVATVDKAILNWAEDRKEDVTLLAESPQIRSALADRSKAASELPAAVAPFLKAYEAIGFDVVDPEGHVIGGADGTFDNLQGNTRDLLKRAVEGQAVVRLIEVKDTTSVLLVAAPVRDSMQRVAAVLVVKFNPAREMQAILQLGRLRESGETYLFDGRGRLLTASRFKGYNQTSSTAEHLVSHEVTRTKSGLDMTGYPDYRGVAVVGAWEWDDTLGVGIVTEMDLAEAAAPVRATRELSIFTLAVIAAVLLAILAILANRTRLIAANAAYEEALKARQDAVAIVSHDLKNPLNTILLACGMLEERPGPTGVLIVRRAAETMLRLITDLLDTAKLEAGQLAMDMQICAAKPLLDDAFELMSPLAERKNISMQCTIADDAPLFRADPKRIVQVLSNLIGNAVKFTPAGGSIHVTANKQAKSGDVEFSISDTGPGIVDDDLVHIFDQYWQAHRTRSQGFGLGLYICKSIVLASGGAIEAHSVPGKGATFVFTLPCAPADPQNKPLPPAGGDSVHPPEYDRDANRHNARTTS